MIKSILKFGLIFSLLFSGGVYVSAQNAPVAGEDAGSTMLNVPLNVAAPGILANDSDADGDPIVVVSYQINGVAGTFLADGTVQIIPGQGTIAISADGSYSFIPSPGVAGAVAKIDYTVGDDEVPQKTDVSNLRIFVDDGNPNVSLTVTSCNQGYIMPEAVSFPNGAYKIIYQLVYKNTKEAYGYDPITQVKNIQISDDLEAVFGDMCILKIERSAIFQQDIGDGVGGTYPRPWLVNQPYNLAEWDASDATPGADGIFDLAVSNDYVLYPRQSISFTFCLYVDPFCSGRPNPTNSGDGIDFTNQATSTSNQGVAMGSLTLTDFHTTESFIAATFYQEDGTNLSTSIVNFDGTYDYTNTVTIVNDGLNDANNVNYNYGLGNFIDDGITFSTLNLSVTGGTALALNGAFDGDANTELLAPGQTLPAGQSIEISIYTVVNPTAFSAYNAFNQPVKSMTLGAVDGFDDILPANKRKTSYVTWSDARGVHVDRYYTDVGVGAPNGPVGSGGQCTCQIAQVRYPFVVSLQIDKTIVGNFPASSGVMGNRDITFRLDCQAPAGNTVHLEDISLTDDLSGLCANGTFDHIVTAPHITISDASVNPSLNLGYNGFGDTNITDGMSGTLDPGQHFIVEFTVEVNALCSGSNIAVFGGNDPLNAAVTSANGAAILTPLLDTDNDGIPDIYDVDDDNDGILDVVEKECASSTPYGATNFITNPDFSVMPGGPFPIAAGNDISGWVSGVPYIGNNVYPPDTRVAQQSGAINYFGGAVQQAPFPGDPAFGVPASNTYLYSNGNTTGAPWKIWEQTITGLTPNTPYTYYAYTSNALDAAVLSVFNENGMMQFLVNGIPSGAPFEVFQDAEAASGHGGVDLWDRRQVNFTTGPGQTSVVLTLQDSQLGNNGDDFVITAVAAREVASCPNKDFDGDGIFDHLDLDSDNDGIPDIIEAGGVDANKDGMVDGFTDANRDGWDDAISQSPLPTPNTDGTDKPDYKDTDADDDGCFDSMEAGSSDGDFDGVAGTGVFADAAPKNGWSTATDTSEGGTYPTNLTDYKNAAVSGACTSALTVTKTITTAGAALNDVIKYDIIVKNTGNVTITNIDVADANADGGSMAGSPIATLAPGASATVTVEQTISGANITAGFVENSATATGDSPAGTDDVSDVSDTDVDADGNAIANNETVDGEDADADTTNDPTRTNLQVAKLTVTKTITTAGSAVNDVIAYDIIVKNTGNVTITNIDVADANADGGSMVGSPIATLAPGASATVTVTQTITEADLTAGFIENSATATGDSPSGMDDVRDVSDTDVDGNGDAIPNNETVDGGDIDNDATNDPTRTTLTPNAELTVTKTITTAGSAVDDVIAYDIIVKNTGNLTITNIDVADANADGGSMVGSPIATLAPGASATVTVTQTITEADLTAGFIENSATATGDSPSGMDDVRDVSDTDVDPDGNAIPNNETVDGDDADADTTNDPTKTTLTPNTELTVTKTITTAGSAVDDVIAYDIIVKNTGNVTITNIDVADANADGGSMVGSPIATLAPGASATVTVTQTITEADLTAGFIENSATATGDSPTGTDDVSDVSDAGDEAVETPNGDGSTDGDATNDPTVTSLIVPIVAEDDAYDATSTGGVIGDVTDNDLLNGVAVSDADITITVDNDGGIGATIDADGNISIPANTPAGTYTVNYTICEKANPGNCDSAIVTITIPEQNLKFYSGFSPEGGNQLNNYWRIDGIEAFPQNEVKIFNRWGNLVYQVTGYDNSTSAWRGQSTEGTVIGEKTVPDGSYFYVVDLKDGNKPRSGYIVIYK